MTIHNALAELTASAGLDADANRRATMNEEKYGPCQAGRMIYRGTAPAFVDHPNEEVLLANRLARMSARLRTGVIDAHTARTMMRLYLEWPRP